MSKSRHWIYRSCVYCAVIVITGVVSVAIAIAMATTHCLSGSHVLIRLIRDRMSVLFIGVLGSGHACSMLSLNFRSVPMTGNAKPTLSPVLLMYLCCIMDSCAFPARFFSARDTRSLRETACHCRTEHVRTLVLQITGAYVQHTANAESLGRCRGPGYCAVDSV
ncbi:hypothetical protein NEOLEDRAFT_139933 [Neolentinus lepideus HHB14362 ss-1]|uniref:Uncharacterized protein n=1 Tax=Neolentinus lepideus HHB14362 ss-1 TaxID=1314782 RepID=A0A165TZJ3_9AGAM|nr:hypothetical protein NEOLEDRAFT_139933 [Neolentinus lepideus HHB14362 ss-1]